jgi:adenylate cyclase
MYADVISLYKTSIESDPSGDDFIQVLGYAYAKSGRRSEAEEVLRKLDELANRQYAERFGPATIYAALGEKDKAFAELEKSFIARDWGIARLSVDYNIDSLRDDPRYKDLVRRMRLPE